MNLRLRRWRRWLLIMLAVLLALAGVGYGVLAASTSRSQVARAVIWGESDVRDYTRFPARRVAAGSTRFSFHRPPGGSSVPPVRTVTALEGGRPVRRDLEQFLAASDTTAFLILRGDTLLYEGYFHGYDHDATQTSMSIAKSVFSAPVGIAIGQGHIGSVDDPITRYVPELLGRDRRFERITLRHLLTMRSGLRYQESGTPWSDDTATYYAPDLRALALERATSMPVATYLERRLWQPLGMEADGSWSLDSRRSGFEKMESGLNGRAIDFAKLGVLYAQGGAWQGHQLVPRDWVQDPTVVPTGDGSIPAPGYGFFWWVQSDRQPPAFFARGKYAQHIYVVPESGLVLVRFGTEVGYQHWPQLLSNLASRLVLPTRGRATRAGLPNAGDAAVPGRCQRQASSAETRWEAIVDDGGGGRRWLGGETALGGLLLLLGILVLLGQALDLELGRVGWPVFVIVPGLGLLGLGLSAAGRLGEVLAMLGGVVTMAGLVLLVQNATDRFETWAYAWTLVLLVGSGIGRWLLGAVRGRRDLTVGGGWLIGAGLVAFVLFAVFFGSSSGSEATGAGHPAATSWRTC